MLDLAEAMASLYDEVSYQEFYRDIFPVGSFEEKGCYQKGKYNGIAVSVGKGEHSIKRYTVTDDLEVIDDLAAGNDFTIISPISYAGKARTSTNARYMYAMAIDLDGVREIGGWNFFLNQINYGHEMLAFVWGLPKPTYLVSSGTGIHIYYVFEKPIPLFKNIVKELEKLKKRLTWQAWTQGASELIDFVQYESLFQGFRMVGTVTKSGGRCRAFRVGEKCDIDYLNFYVPDAYRVKDITYKSNLTLAEAQQKYPDWYQKRIVENRPRNTWTCNKGLYNWWINKTVDAGEGGHRYWCIMTLATYAKKCAVSRSQLEADAFRLREVLEKRGDHPFTEDDVIHALEAYMDSYITYPIHTIETRTGIRIERNKRNGRKQVTHLKIARFARDIEHENWREGNGRKPKDKLVQEWRESHPNGTKIECQRETGISRPTIIKWWERKTDE